MSLGTRLTLKTAVLVLAVFVIAGVAIWGMGGLNRDLDAALEEYDQLREAYTLMVTIEQARFAAKAERVRLDRIEQPLMRALIRMGEDSPTIRGMDAEAIAADVQLALRSIGQADGQGMVTPPAAVSGYLNTAVNRLASHIDELEMRIERIDRDADAHRRRTVMGVGGTAALTAVLAILVGAWQYLAVMRPLRRLQRGVQRLSSGDFAEPLKATGDREFVRLADDFNRMANELSTLYRDLEDKVRLRSAQLAQSERLASVGFLAAGVAHEINNPLAIIAGEAELSLIDPSLNADAAARSGLITIRDEAFRCKAITQKLLSLARPGSGRREGVHLLSLAREVASLVKTLPQHEGRSLTVLGDARAHAWTDPSQVKQVLLNLVINALEATDPPGGQVQIDVQSRDAFAVLSVRDNGKGIEAEALSRVFEPFFTSKKSPTTPGLGLGLSISHAIIEDLDGRLTALSDGPGLGSTFVIELPLTQNGTTL